MVKTSISVLVAVRFIGEIEDNDLMSIGEITAEVGVDKIPYAFDFMDIKQTRGTKYNNGTSIQFELFNMDTPSEELNAPLISNISGFKDIVIVTPENKDIYPVAIDYVILNIETNYDDKYDKREICFNSNHPSIEEINKKIFKEWWESEIEFH